MSNDMMKTFEEIYKAAVNPVWEEFRITPINRNFYCIDAADWRRFYRVAKENGFEVVEDFCRDGLCRFYVEGAKRADFRSQIRAKLGLPL